MGPMVYSLGEIEAQAKKAARGAGFAWGYAEEAGKVARWLAAHQLPGAVLLAAYLNQRHDAPRQYQAPRVMAHHWYPFDNGILCPLLTGAYMCDRGIRVIESPLVLRQVAYPLLLIPYLARITEASSDTPGEIYWQGTRLHCQENRLQNVQDDQLMVPSASPVYCGPAPQTDLGKKPGCLGQEIDDEIWQILDEFVYRTYVPATEASRRGAGPSD